MPVILLLLLLFIGCVAKVPPPAVEPTKVPLEEMVQQESDPRRAASMKFVEEGRKEMVHERWERAAQQFSRGIEIDSANPFAYYYLGVTRFRANRHSEAFSLFARAGDLFVNLSNWKADAIAYQGVISEKQTKIADAVRWYESALKLDGSNARAREGLARLQSSQDH